jgi:hypothetical protein
MQRWNTLFNPSIYRKKQSPIYFGRSSILIESEIELKLYLELTIYRYVFTIGDDPSSAYGHLN